MSERESGWYWVRALIPSSAEWTPGWWNGKFWLLGGSRFGEDLAVGPRIFNPDEADASEQQSTAPPAPDITLKDVARVLKAMEEDNPGVPFVFEMQARGQGGFRPECGNDVANWGSMSEGEERFRRALDFLDAQPQKTVIDVLRGE